ncbi:fatty acid cis/trans isomerase [Gilvimarinus xylanilyticus]|uniref:Fatty acid cis/trans isomerase n=1 Tax=Gilvimarinus xylanilyticus TaxID=2944139 RepID=A0A9X2HZ69_9GAMM|nr:fatty acid cis/trans isomerase [Gilvimarinus xylanilyticus]MCP8900760.1 fatty acid cis/trans isomerase [Gilvimarinus xylanilyticus]
MKNRSIALILFLLSGCVAIGASSLDTRFGKPEPREMSSGKDASHYQSEVKPLIEARCTVCHGCYDAPCQLKMDADLGLLRGASKEKVYDGTRLFGAELTRLFTDADSTRQWREKDFYPVLNERQNTPKANLEGSVMARMLKLKQAHPLPEGEVLPESFDFSTDREQYCPTVEEFEDFAQDYPLWGMPYGLPGLPEQEQDKLLSWVRTGASFGAQPAVPAELLPHLERWEDFFNGPSLRAQLVNRYLYEHLFLASLRFENAPDVTFKLVRSSTPPGQPIKRITTRRPFDDPKVERVYYRLWHDPSSRLAKTFMPYALNHERMDKWQRWFYDADYMVSKLPGYGAEVAANPFASFAQLPIDSRYRFLLDEAEFTIMNFIKGPVCRGQIALNVIEDHFWVFFVSPNTMNPVTDGEFFERNADHLRLPAEAGNTFRPVSRWMEYASLQEGYLKAKAEYIRERADRLGRIDMQLIWDGSGHNDNSALTILRHNDSASVVRGMIGPNPKTAWLIDYPLLERIHYLLVAGFDVYGNVSHQLLSRLYMDFLRIEGEMNFVALLPETEQNAIIKSWYRGAEDDINSYLNRYLDQLPPTQVVDYQTDTPKAELLQALAQHVAPSQADSPHIAPLQWPEPLAKALGQLQSTQGVAASLMPEASVLLMPDEGVFSLMRTSAHSNVASLFSEQDRRRPQEDQLVVTAGIVPAYPNTFWRVDKGQLPQFIAQVQKLETEADYRRLKESFGIGRNHPQFWEISDQIHRDFAQQQPASAGLLDYNRLENR